MLEQPPLLTIRRGFARPSADELAPFTGAEAAQLADALGGAGALDHAIRPLPTNPGPDVVVGPALTVSAGPADVLAVLAALDVAQTGDVLVVAAAGHTGTATVGDLFAAAARAAGVAAYVTDGLVRDARGIARAGLPVWAKGTCPNSPAANGPGTIGLPVVVGGVRVDAGDLVVCEPDGVVVVPRARLAEAAAGLARVRELEAAAAERIAAGEVLPPAIRELLASDRVREV